MCVLSDGEMCVLSDGEMCVLSDGEVISSPPIVLPPSSSIIVTVEVAYGEVGTEDESVR